MFIYPYKVGSNSARLLADGLKAKLIKLENSKFKGGKKLVINWGNSTPNEEVEKCIVLNHPSIVKVASNKHLFFQQVDGKCSIPEYTTDKEVAKGWISDGKEIVVREKLTGNSGEGIVILEDMIEYDSYAHNRAKLYVQYVPKKQEYRIHIFAGLVALIQRKAKPNNVHAADVNYKVRNHKNGFIFVKGGAEETPKAVIDEAQKAITACGLDFGAVDVVFNEYRDKAYVLEINTAPGLDGTTPDTYIEIITAYANMLGEKPEEKLSGKKLSMISWNEIVNADVQPIHEGQVLNENEFIDEDDEEEDDF